MGIIYNLEYNTQTDYVSCVNEAVYELNILPDENENQKITNFEISSSLNNGYTKLTNCFGFKTISISSKEKFTKFEFNFKCRVFKELEIVNFQNFLNYIDEIAVLSSLEFKIDNYLFLHNTAYTTLDSAHLSMFTKYQDKQLFFYLQELNEQIYNGFTFCDKSTTVCTKANEVADIKRGVCQDFAHLFIGICRTQGIATRYVSGYLHQGIGYYGDAFLHAWVEVFIPNVGWVGFDPTNNLLADEHYIKISHGADYNDCTPIKGALKYSGDMQTSYKVKVLSNASQ